MKTIVLIVVTLTLFLVAQVSYGQDKTVTGTVTDQDGIPLPGVNVLVKATTNGTQTDFDGNYAIETSESEILIFSYLGQKTLEMGVGESDSLNVQMEEDAAQLDEVIVVGYGSQSKRKVTDNIATISSDQLNEIPTPSLQSALTGKAAGVRITQINGKVEGGIKVRVRGVSTISSSQEPLYVVDGVPITNADESTNDSPINPLVSINPNDIESIQILKDASSAAIYGARGTNGVVLITTKSGKNGKTKVSLNTSYGWSQATNKRDWLNASEYRELFLESRLNGGLTEAEIQDQFDFYENGQNNVDTDWQDLALVDGSVQDTGVSVSGGDAKTRFFLSTGYNKTDGIVRGNTLERYSLRANIDHDISAKFKTGVNASISKSKIDRISNDNAFATPLQAIAQTPLTPAYQDDGITPNNDTTEYYNFLTEQFNGNFQVNIWRVIANTFLQYQIVPS